MPSRNYWLNLFSGTTWQEFLDAKAEVSGFRRPLATLRLADALYNRDLGGRHPSAAR